MIPSDLPPIVTQFNHRDEKPSESSTISLAAVPESDVLSSPISPSQEFDPTVGAKPFSPFYRHATPTHTLERLKLPLKKARSRTSSVNEHELIPENEVTATTSTTTMVNLHTLEEGDGEGGGTHRQSKLWAQRKRRCDCMRTMSRKQRMVVKAAIAIGTLGSMVAIALGITAAVGGGVWRSDNQHKVIGS